MPGRIHGFVATPSRRVTRACCMTNGEGAAIMDAAPMSAGASASADGVSAAAGSIIGYRTIIDAQGAGVTDPTSVAARTAQKEAGVTGRSSAVCCIACDMAVVELQITTVIDTSARPTGRTKGGTAPPDGRSSDGRIAEKQGAVDR